MSALRQALLDRLRQAVTAQPFILAAWLEGADAAGRADAYSDVDLWLDVEPGHSAAAFELLRGVMQSFGSPATEQVQAHADPLIEQRFFRSASLSAFCFLDACIQQHGRDVGFGPADEGLVWFDPLGVIRRVSADARDVHSELRRLSARRWRWVLVEKELLRGHALEALAYYHAEVLPPLVEALRWRWCPGKAQYGLKHAHADLPAEVLGRLETLYSLSGPEELPSGLEQAGQWLDELLAEAAR